MDCKSELFNHINTHFKVDTHKEEIVQINAFDNFNPFPYIRNEKTNEDYIIFDMPSSFQINLYEYSKNATISITFDSQYEVYYKEKNRNNPYIDDLHKQNFYQLTYVLDGNLDLLIEGKRLCIPRHSLLITNRNVKQIEERRSEFTVLHLCFKSEFIDELTLQTKHLNSNSELSEFFKANYAKSDKIDYLIFEPTHPDHSNTEKNIKTIVFEMMYKEAGYLEICKHFMTRLFLSIQNPTHFLCMHTCFSPSQERTLFEETLKFIIDSKRKVTREEIGKALNYNGNYISHVFQKYSGISLAKYTRDICLSHATHLLLNTNMQIRDIISELGYENKTAFYKNFKEKFGMNPGEYRYFKNSLR